VADLIGCGQMNEEGKGNLPFKNAFDVISYILVEREAL
jgi:hypothetical protein